MAHARDEEGLPLVWLLPYLISFIGLFVAVKSAPGPLSLATTGVIVVASTVGAAYAGWRATSGLLIMMATVVPAVMIAFLVLPLQPLSGWLAGLVCDDAHPVLAPVVEQLEHHATAAPHTTLLIAQACFTESGDDPQLTLLPGAIWAVILLVWFALATIAGVFAFAIRHPEQAAAAGRPRR